MSISFNLSISFNIFPKSYAQKVRGQHSAHLADEAGTILGRFLINNQTKMSKFKAQMPNQGQNPNVKIYDLEERTAKFGEDIIEFTKTLERNAINYVLVSQAVRAGTSIGANYCEADGAESKKDFRHKIATCKKEAKEIKHWLRMIAKANPEKRKECQKLWREAQELTLIFSSILKPEKKN